MKQLLMQQLNQKPLQLLTMQQLKQISIQKQIAQILNQMKNKLMVDHSPEWILEFPFSSVLILILILENRHYLLRLLFIPNS